MKPIVAQTFFGVAAGIGLVALSFGKILLLHFGGDDFTALYYAQNHMILPYPYYADSLRESLLYRLFHLTAWPYYGLSILLFCLVTVLVGYFAYLVFQKRTTALFAILFFIFSFVGSGAMYSAAEAIRYTSYLILQLATLCVFFLYNTRKRQWRYLASIILFGLTVILFPYRAFPLIFLLFLTTLFCKPRPTKPISTVSLLLPFLFLTVITYGILPRLPSVENIRQFSVAGLAQRLTVTSFVNYSLTFLFLFLPNTAFRSAITFRLWLTALRLIAPVFFLSVTALVFFLKPTAQTKAIRFTFLTLLVTLAGYFAFSSDYYETGFRYLMVVRPFLSVFLAGVAAWALSPRPFSSLARGGITLFLITVFSLQTWQHLKIQRQEVAYRGSYLKNAIATIHRTLPQLSGYSIFFIDGETNELRDQFAALFRVGFLPAGTALAIYYGTTYYTIEVTDRVHCDGFNQIRERWKGKNVNIYYFLATANGIVQGSAQTAFERCNMDE